MQPRVSALEQRFDDALVRVDSAVDHERLLVQPVPEAPHDRGSCGVAGTTRQQRNLAILDVVHFVERDLEIDCLAARPGSFS